jgi:flagellar basal-body rod protein FlgG
LDVAIEGKGMLQFRMPDGTTSYSRAGNLHMDAEGNILNPNGHPLEPSVQVPRNVTDLIINEEGRVFVQIEDNTELQEVGQIMLANFPNPEGLRDMGQNLWAETSASGESTLAVPGEDGVGEVKQRALEFSNVNIIEEMMQMLLCQRTFELVVKTISASDAMLKIASDISK